MVESAQSRLPAPFVVGVSRSGTTLLRLMLDAHPDLAIPHETRFLPGLIEVAGDGCDPGEVADFLFGWERWSDFHLDQDALRNRLQQFMPIDAGQAARCFFELYAEGQGKPRWGDKSPPYVNHVAAIHAAIPEAVVIHLIRDGRDVCVSLMNRSNSMRNPRPIARRWVDEVTAARRQGASLPTGSYIEIRYEDLTAEPEAVLREICSAIELDWDSAMLDFHAGAADRLAELSDITLADGNRRTAAERMLQFKRVNAPVSLARTGAWRRELSREDRDRFEKVAAPLLAELGYPTQ